MGEIKELTRKAREKAMEDMRQMLNGGARFSSAKKDICEDLKIIEQTFTIEMFEEQGEGGYSGARYSRNSYGNGYYRDSYNSSYDGDSYDDGGYSGRHYVRGHYSREDGQKNMIENLRRMMEEAPDQRQKDAIGDCINQLNSQR